MYTIQTAEQADLRNGYPHINGSSSLSDVVRVQNSRLDPIGQAIVRLAKLEEALGVAALLPLHILQTVLGNDLAIQLALVQRDVFCKK